MLKKFALASLLAFLTIGLGTYFYLGGYYTAKFETALQPKLMILYQKHQGAYNKINESIERVETYLLEQNLNCKKAFGLFWDNPEEIQESDLRSYGGCIVQKPFVQLPKGFFYEEIAAQKALKASFFGSPALGPMKVYPKAKESLIESGFLMKESIEIYEEVSKGKYQTTYYFPLRKN